MTFGRTIVLALDELESAEADLHEIERARAAELSPIRRREFVAGRTALRRLANDIAPILADDRGAPILPKGMVGSISHTKTRVAAIIAPDDGARVGVDLEKRAGLRYDISKRILVEPELARLPVDPAERESRVLLTFSIKEAIYKAIDPFVRRYVGFHEVELVIADDGTASVATLIPLVIEARWQILDEGHFLSTARARRR